MNRSLLFILTVAGIVGIGLGSYRSLSRRLPPVPPPGVSPDGTSLDLPVRNEFPLLPADIQADRETPTLAIDTKGRVVLAFASQTGPLERTLYLSHSTDGKTFDKPSAFRKVPIYKYAAKSHAADPAKKPGEPEPAPMTYSTHVLPRLVASGDEISLGWVEAVDGGPKVIYYVARSIDGGHTFASPIPASTKAGTPGFTSLASGPKGEVEAVWMEGGKPISATKRPGSDGFDAETIVYPGPASGTGICPCCDLAVARPADNPLVVAFRNNDGDRRDIWITQAQDNGFKPAVPVGDHRWVFKGCPHDGPALAAQGGRLQVAFMDAHTGFNRIYFAESDPSTIKFEPSELSPESKGSQGHPRLAPVGLGVFAVWDESLEPSAPAPTATAGHGHGPHAPTTSGGGRAIRISHACDARTFDMSKVIDPRPGSFQLNPAVIAMPDGDALVAWNELNGDGKRIVVAKVKPPGH